MKQKIKPTIPSPGHLLAKAKAVPRGVVLGDYVNVMWTLKDKGLSLREIAGWLAKELGVPVTHMQVYRAMQNSLPPDRHIQSEEEMDAKVSRQAELDEEAKS